MIKYALSFEAEADLQSIRTFVRNEAGPIAAHSTLTKVMKAIRFLSITPGAGHIREDLTDEEYRFWSVYSYMIIYDATTEPIGIVRILHGNRDISSILNSENVD